MITSKEKEDAGLRSAKPITDWTGADWVHQCEFITRFNQRRPLETVPSELSLMPWLEENYPVLFKDLVEARSQAIYILDGLIELTDIARQLHELGIRRDRKIALENTVRDFMTAHLDPSKRNGS